MKTTLILLMTLLLTTAGCTKQETATKQQRCGCESKTLSEIPNYESQENTFEGSLFYKRKENVDNIFDDEHDGKYDNNFWIVRNTHHYIICNKEILGSDFDFLKNVSDSISVDFSGQLKPLCIEPFSAPTEYGYWEIKINLIEKL